MSQPKLSALAAFGLLATVLWCCSRTVVPTEFPVVPRLSDSASKSAPTASSSSSLAGTAPDAVAATQGYWSIYAYMDEQNVQTRWNRSGLSYVLISATVDLPIKGGSLRRELPLYSVEGGLVQSHSGIDLLRRFPISGSRDQVAITLEVRYLENKEALENARNILGRFDALAGPFAGNLKVASEILAASLATIDDTVPNERTKNSKTIYLKPSDLKQGLRAYLLRLDNEVQDDPIYGGGTAQVTECSDIRGALCMHPGSNYRKDAVNNVVYVTLDFVKNDDVYDPAALLPGGASCSQLNEGRIAQSREYMTTNEDLFVETDVRVAHDAYDLADRYMEAIGLVEDGDFAALVDLVEREERSSKQASKSVQQLFDRVKACYDALWQRSPYREVRSAYALSQARGLERAEQYMQTVVLLRELAGLSGSVYDAGDKTAWHETSGTVVQQLHGLARVHEDDMVKRLKGYLSTASCGAQQHPDKSEAFCGRCETARQEWAVQCADKAVVQEDRKKLQRSMDELRVSFEKLRTEQEAAIKKAIEVRDSRAPKDEATKNVPVEASGGQPGQSAARLEAEAEP